MTAEHRTIATVRTPPGRGGIAVVFVRGEQAEGVISKVFRPARRDSARHRRLQLGHVVADGRVLDEAILCRTPNGLELQVHAGPQVVRELLELLAGCGAEVRPPDSADVADLPTAHPRWNNPRIGRELLAAMPLARSTLVAAAISAQWSGGITELARRDSPVSAELRAAAEGLATMQRLLHPAEVVLAGPPNAGKSALANALVGRNVSIVHQSPGTTRDWVRTEATMNAVPVWLTDTAGIWTATTAEDAEAVGRARERVRQADLVLLVQPGGSADVPGWCPQQRTLRVASKADITPPVEAADVAVSAQTGEGLEDLRKAVVAKLFPDGFEPTQPRAFTQRQARLLAQAANAADSAGRRAALEEMLTGRVSPTR